MYILIWAECCRPFIPVIPILASEAVVADSNAERHDRWEYVFTEIALLRIVL
jgi:hypothetical protein